MEEQVGIQEVFLEFRAGKMFSQGTRVIPDTRKGLFRLLRGQEGLLHFQWLDRTHNTVEDDQIIFPDEAVFEKEPKSDADQLLCNSVNEHINRPLEDLEEIEVSLQTSEMAEDTVDGDLSSRAGILVDQSTGSEFAGEVSSGPVQLADLQRILRSIQPGDGVEDSDGGFGLGDILRPDLVMPLIETFPLDQGLASHLPEGPWTPDAFLDLLQSPPFRQQVDTFSHVLRTGQIDLSQFGIDPSKYKFTVLSFLEALEDSVAQSQSSSSGGEAMDES